MGSIQLLTACLAYASHALGASTATAHTPKGFSIPYEDAAKPCDSIPYQSYFGEANQVKGRASSSKELAVLLLSFHSGDAFISSSRGVRFPKIRSDPISWRTISMPLSASRRVQPVQGKLEYSVIDVLDAEVKDEDLLSQRMAQVVNWAYRGKYDVEDANAWTGERHLLSGIRTNAADVLEMLRTARKLGPTQQALFIAMQGAPGEPHGTNLSSCVGTIQVQRNEDGTEAEIGLFSVDPDLQSQGLGGSLLRKAEQHAAEVMGVQLAVLWVITVRDELLQWYERSGYKRTVQTAPFPTEANVGMPRQGTSLEFVRLEKELK